MYTDKKRESLKDKILSHGGSNVHVVGDSKTIEMWAKRGEFMNGENSIVHEDTKMMMCHNNSIDYYLANKDVRICTGFALTKSKTGNDMWVRHTWCIDKNGIIHECTPTKRDLYFGTILNEKEAEQFREDYDFEYAASKKTGINQEDQKQILSVNDIKSRTQDVSIDDKKTINSIFDKWKKRLLEMGLSK